MVLLGSNIWEVYTYPDVAFIPSYWLQAIIVTILILMLMLRLMLLYSRRLGFHSKFFKISAEPATEVFDCFFNPSQPPLPQIN